MASAACLSEKTNVVSSKRQKRREKSRDAARFRRHKESDTFDDICDTIPIPPEVLNHLDKSAIMRLLISYIKLRQVMNGREQEVVKKEVMDEELLLSDEDFVNSLNGFLLVLSAELDVLYVSDNVKDYLGLSKFDLMGQSILQYTHEGDHDDLKACFDQKTEQTSFFMRLKSTLTVNGRNINLKSASYKVLRCSGVVLPNSDSSYMIAHAEPLPHPANIEHLLDSMTFVSQHSPDMKFTYCDEKFSTLLGYTEPDLLDRSYYDFCHVADMKSINDYFHKLYRLNQVETNLYRFLSKSGGYLWMMTQATVITNQKSHKPQCIVCVHYVISGLERPGLPLSSEQLDHCVPVLCEEIQSSIAKSEIEGKKLEEIVLDADLSEYSNPLDEDDCSFVPLTFDDLDETDGFLSEDLCYNAPSIGDPWAYSENTTPCESVAGDVTPFVEIQDVLGDVMMDSPPKQPDPKHTYNPLTLTDLPPLNSQPESTEMWTTSPGYKSVGSASPCDSAYCGSPPHEPLQGNSPNRRPSNQGVQAMAWQSVGVPAEQYARHVGHLKRGHVLLEGPDSCGYMEKKPVNAKRQCFAPTINPVAKKFGWNPLKNPLQNPAMLLQPGDSYGCEGGGNSLMDFDPSFLLQPDLNLDRKFGQQMVRNPSSGFLPELSIRDCEVNAPLSGCGSVLPLGMDCVHLLDTEA